MQLKERLNMSEGLFVLKGRVQIFDENNNVELDKDNAITNSLRKMLLYKLYDDIVKSKPGLNTVQSVHSGTDIAGGFIESIKFGRGDINTMGAKASRNDTTLLSEIPSKTDDNNDLYINTSIDRDLNIVFDFDKLEIKFTADLVNNDTKTYVLGELGVFDSNLNMLTHLYFDPIFFESNTTKKIVYTIYMY